MAADREWRNSARVVGQGAATAMASDSRRRSRRLRITLFSFFVFSHFFVPLAPASAATLWSDGM